MEADMARTNLKTKADRVYTHEGAPAVAGLKPLDQLKRSVLACFLWEGEFYEDGQSIADRIRATAEKCKPEDVAALALTARKVHNLRHVPLLLLEVLTRTGAGKPGLVSGAIEQTISRADELAEFLAIYKGKRKDGEWALSGQAKKGLAKAFKKFSGYQLAKYNRDGAFKLRDVLFLAHAKPETAEQKLIWAQLIDGTLESPDTWEVNLSAGKDKRETFERLLREGQLGYFALLRNLHNMEQAGVDHDLVKAAILARKGGAEKLLPFRYIAAARAAPSLEREIDQALLAAIAELPPLKGRTGVLVDVSGSMDAKLSAKSDLKRIDAAAALASIINAEDIEVASFSCGLAQVPPRRGMAGVDAVINSQPHAGTYLGQALSAFQTVLGKRGFDRIIVVTDEQSHDAVPAPKAEKAYMINVASAKNGVGYRNGWVHVDGFSEGVLKYIHAIENQD
jgi:60 kDa SS-A/Ro ribonucleoprotein